MKYRKKPIVVEAFRYGIDSVPEWFTEATITMRTDGGIGIVTLEGCMCANKGDYIVKGIRGEIYPCKADIFEEIYEKVEELKGEKK